mmetsp:Transcript_154909/g.274671  ORF Transcript_154909/g.274671 Transcript_154909/m.274671 type:complete len:217 (+) Transcript_154909:255-905(+)
MKVIFQSAEVYLTDAMYSCVVNPHKQTAQINRLEDQHHLPKLTVFADELVELHCLCRCVAISPLPQALCLLSGIPWYTPRKIPALRLRRHPNASALRFRTSAGSTRATSSLGTSMHREMCAGSLQFEGVFATSPCGHAPVWSTHSRSLILNTCGLEHCGRDTNYKIALKAMLHARRIKYWIIRLVTRGNRKVAPNCHFCALQIKWLVHSTKRSCVF